MKANRKITMTVLAGIVLGVLTIVVSGNAALAQDTVRVRGAIESIDGSTYAIKSRDGADLKVVLADNAQIAAVVKASLADIKQGLFVGVTAMPQADELIMVSRQSNGGAYEGQPQNNDDGARRHRAWRSHDSCIG